MSITCSVSLQREASPEQLRALGAALWRWCNRTAGIADIYHRLDNQALADMIAGEFPSASPLPGKTESYGVSLCVKNVTPGNLQSTIRCLRREIPCGGVEDIVVDGTSWNHID